MKNSVTTSKFPLPKGNIWTRLPERIKALEDKPAPFILPYKVFTALLTQSGGDDPQAIGSGDLTIGVTYLIGDGNAGADFTNVGAPNNDNGTYFVATGIAPSSWGTDGNLKYNTGAPVAIVLENTIGNIWFTYADVGYYKANSNNLFNNKTGLLVEPLSTINGLAFPYMEYKDANILTIVTSEAGIAPNNGFLYNTMIEIRVYN